MTDLTDAPRLPALGDAGLDPDVRDIIARWPYRLHRTLAHSPATLKAWLPYAEHILRDNRLPERDRELAILRVAWNTRSAYEWGLHVRLARSIGFSDADITAVVAGPEAAHFTALESALVRGVDEIMRDWEVGAATWKVLAEGYGPDQQIDYLFVVCQFVLVAVTLKSLRIPVEEGVEPLPPG